MQIFILLTVPVITQGVSEIDKVLLKATGNALTHFFDMVQSVDYHKFRVSILMRKSLIKNFADSS